MHVSLLGQVALFAFVPICIALFAKLRLDQATALALIGACLFLPERIELDPPLIPSINKHSISTFITFFSILAIQKTPTQGSSFFKLIILILLVGCVGSVLTNQDTLVLAPGVVIPGLPYGDVISLVWRQAASLLVPFAIGMRVFNTKESVLTLLRVVASLGVIYGFLMLVEIRLSPQLNTWVYGFHQHSFEQSVRNGGYRPVVFMSHGLTTTMFCLMAIYAAIGLQKSGATIFGAKATYWSIFLTVVLLLSNSMGAFLFCIFGTVLLWMGRPRLISIAATLMALAAISVPFLRADERIPVQEIVDFFATINAERASSLGFRINMEEQSLGKWSERPWFGYAGYGRADIFNEDGKSTVVMDSQWIIAFCYRGVVGYVGEFLLYVVPVFAARKHLSRITEPTLQPALLSLVMMVAVSSFDLLVNSSSHCMLPLFAGSLFGLSKTLKQQTPATVTIRPVSDATS